MGEVYVDKIIEKEVVIENKIEKPVVVERVIENELDVELQASVEIYTREYEGLIQRKRELEEYLRSLQARLAEFGPSTNYFNEISVLRKKITHLEVEISTLKNKNQYTSKREANPCNLCC